MSEMVERIARALMGVKAPIPAGDGTPYHVLDRDPDFDDLPLDHTQGTIDDPITQEAVRSLARIAILVMRAPTTEMINSLGDRYTGTCDPIVAWEDMIDAALK